MTTTANCPSCGGPIEFAIGSSIVVVCSYCRSLVARNDRGLENLGKVAALIDTGSPLRVGLAGKYRGNGFRITGRTQMQHQAGGVWDEWYAAFDDGRWGWVAEAQGRFYVTFATKANAPEAASLVLGGPVPDVGNLVVNEIGTAQLASAEGEIPWKPEPGASYDYADLTGTDRKFATIDYSEDPPLVFTGHEVALSQLGLESLDAAKTRVSVTRLNCANCGGALDLRMREQTERIFCPNCGAAQDVDRNGKLQLLVKSQDRRVTPTIPLGATGTFDGVEYVVAGFMERAVDFDRTYYWLEYLLFNREAGFRWLVESDGHWSFVHSVPAGEVQDAAFGGKSAKRVFWKGRRYSLFQDAVARVTYVEGEFYWKVEVGEKVDTADYIAPPHGLSKEVSTSNGQEVNYSHAVYVKRKEIETIFGLKRLPRPEGIGPLQPYDGPRFGKPYAFFLILLVLVALIALVMQPNRVVHTQSLRPSDTSWSEGPAENARTYFTEAFKLDGRHNVVIDARSPVNNSWSWIGGELVNETTGETEAFEVPIEYYHGVDGGESWREGSQDNRAYISAPPAGSYSLRLEAQWEKPDGPPIDIRVREGVFRPLYFILAFIALTLVAGLGLFAHFSFEVARWKDSSYSPYGSGD